MATGDYSTYDEIFEGVQQNLNRTDLDANIPTFMALAQKRINRVLRLPLNQRTEAVVFTPDTNESPEPSDYLESFQFSDEGGAVIQRIQLQAFLQLPASGGSGQFYEVVTRSNGKFMFWPGGSSGAVEHTYYFAPAPITSTNQTNELSTVAGELILMAAVAEGWRFVRNEEKLVLYSQLYDGILQELSDQWREEETSGSTMISGNPYQGDSVSRIERT